MIRRSFLVSTVSLVAVGGVLLANPQPAAAEHPAVAYIRKVSDDLLAAQRSGTITSFSRVLRRHADIPGISMYSLGNYSSRLPQSKRNQYYKGVTAFMARYFADQTRKYRVAKAEIAGGATNADGNLTEVNTRITLLTGSAYNVKFLLRRSGKNYKVADVRVQVPILGFVSLTYQQRGIFQRYLAQKGGDVNALVATLNR